MKTKIPPEIVFERLAVLGLTQAELGRRLGLPRSSIFNWTRRGNYPNWPTHLALCNILKLDPESLEVIE